MDVIPLSEQEVQRLRAETKGTGKVIHFNNAGSSLPPDVVVDTIIGYLEEEAVNGGYETDTKYTDLLYDTYNLIAKLINAQPEEIAVVENASVAWGIAFHGISFKSGDVVLTSEYEYVTNLIGFLNFQKTYGIEIKVIPNDERGNFSITALEEAISERTKLIAVTHIASTTGGILPVAEIGKIARKHHILYLLDACQSVGHVPVDVEEIGCDMLAVTGRKYLRAPRGTGFLYVKKEVQDKLKPVYLDGFSVQWVTEHDFKLRDDARRFELYENNKGIKLGLRKAVEYALNIGADRIWDRVQKLANVMRTQLNAIDGIAVHDTGDELCGIVSFSVAGIDSALVKAKLAGQGINVSVALAKSALYFMNKNSLSSTVRASVHYYNTEEEIKALCDALVLIGKEDFL